MSKHSLITSQFDTAPKLVLSCIAGLAGLITSQFDTAPKQRLAVSLALFPFDYQSVRHCSKTALLTVGNVKYVEKNSKSSETLMETMTRGRVYALVDRGDVKSIVYFDSDNRRRKQIDLKDHRGISPHTHIGYLHNENSPNGQPVRLSSVERKMVDRVLSSWEKYRKGEQ